MTKADPYLNKKDVALAEFAKALGLPVRVGIIRLTLENGNRATREVLQGLPFSQQAINQHLAELKYAGILRSEAKQKVSFFSVNEDLFIKMSNNFLNLFEAIGKLNEEGKSVISRPRLKKKRVVEEGLKEIDPGQRFGKFVQLGRRGMGITQFDLSKELGIDRHHLSRLECSRRLFRPEHLNKIANLLQVPLNVLTKFYNQDKKIGLFEEQGHLISTT